jgi:hypothetical protein
MRIGISDHIAGTELHKIWTASLPWLFYSFCLAFQQNISLMKTPPQFHRTKQQDQLPAFQVRHKKESHAHEHKVHPSKMGNRRFGREYLMVGAEVF